MPITQLKQLSIYDQFYFMHTTTQVVLRQTSDFVISVCISKHKGPYFQYFTMKNFKCT